MQQNFDLNFTVETVAGAKRHYGFHINAESKEEAEAHLAADLKQVITQCAAAPAAGATGKAAKPKAGKTAKAAPAAKPAAKAKPAKK